MKPFLSGEKHQLCISEYVHPQSYLQILTMEDCLALEVAYGADYKTRHGIDAIHILKAPQN